MVLEVWSFVIYKVKPFVISGSFLGTMDYSLPDFTYTEFRKEVSVVIMLSINTM